MTPAFLFHAASAVTAAAVIVAAPVWGAPDATAQPQSTASTPTGSDKICKYVVAPGPGAKPYQLCLSKAAWAAKDKLDALDATRIECHYVEKTGSKLESAKVCMPAAEWKNSQQADRDWIDWVQRQGCVPGAGC